jgi:hypothetical protein
MSTTKIKSKAIYIAALFILTVAFSSCNRGYGCPQELNQYITSQL